MDKVERKLQKIKKELLLEEGELFLDKSSFYIESEQEDFEEYEQDLEEYLKESSEDGRYAWCLLQDLHRWHNERSRMISLTEDAQESDHLSKGAQFGYQWLRLGPQVTPKYRDDNPPDIWIEDAARVVADLLLVGHFNEVAEVTKKTSPELHSPYLEGGWEYYPHAWFLLDLCCRWQGAKLDTRGCDTPEELGIYEEVLECWNTPDLDKVQALVNTMSDYHMSESQENIEEEETRDFSETKYWLFPYEILAWLKLREYLGLPNPDQYEHPLMNLPQAQMPEDTPFPKNQLLDKVVAKLIADHDISM